MVAVAHPGRGSNQLGTVAGSCEEEPLGNRLAMYRTLVDEAVVELTLAVEGWVTEYGETGGAKVIALPSLLSTVAGRLTVVA